MILEKTLKPVLLTSAILLLSGCGSSDDDTQEIEVDLASLNGTAIEEVFTASSPWATTGVFLQTDGVPDKSTNFIADTSISAGTVSSAQYRDGMFIFAGLADFTTGLLDEDSLIQSMEAVTAAGAAPSGFSFGDYAVIRDGQGNAVRRIRNASFAPTAVIDRTVTVATAQEFGYIFTADDGLTYFVEHKPYADAFPDETYPASLQTAVDAFFDGQFSEEDRVNLALRSATPLATTGVFREVNGEIDESVNFITDSDISAGTISSAQYRDGRFMFVGLEDFTTGAINVEPLIASLTSDGATQPAGFSFGDFEIFTDADGNLTRRLTNASFAPTATIDRVVTVATNDLFTYTFERDGETFHVQHKPYSVAFPGAVFPEELQSAIDQFFTAL